MNKVSTKTHATCFIIFCFGPESLQKLLAVIGGFRNVIEAYTIPITITASDIINEKLQSRFFYDFIRYLCAILHYNPFPRPNESQLRTNKSLLTVNSFSMSPTKPEDEKLNSQTKQFLPFRGNIFYVRQAFQLVITASF